LKNFVNYLLDHSVHKLSEVYRFSSQPKLRQENVAEHSFYVTVYAVLIAERLKLKGSSYFIDEIYLMKKCLFHDLEEAFTGDVIKPVKHDNPELSGILEDYAFKKIEEIFDGYSKTIPRYLIQKDNARFLEDFILKTADLLSVVVSIIKELKFGNKHFLPAFETCSAFVVRLINKIEKYKNMEHETVVLDTMAIDDSLVFLIDVLKITNEVFKETVKEL